MKLIDHWHDLSGTELRQRLERRGCPPETAAWLVARREHPEEARRISEWLRR